MESFCQLLVSPAHEVLISTNPTGRNQPGSMSLEWVVGEEEQQPGERSKNPRKFLGCDERVADVIILKGDLVTTVFEIKSKPGGGLDQNKEQMAELLQRGQTAILGFVVDPREIQINLFVANHEQKKLSLHNLEKLSLLSDVGASLEKWASLIMYFNNMVV